MSKSHLLKLIEEDLNQLQAFINEILNEDSGDFAMVEQRSKVILSSLEEHVEGLKDLH